MLIDIFDSVQGLATLVFCVLILMNSLNYYEQA